MKFNKTAALLSAVIVAAMPFGTVFAAGESENKLPVYQDDFNKNDVNGRVMVMVPENVKAHVEITFDSPEGEGILYYDSDVDGKGYFDIEGRNTTDDDFRNYNLTISLTSKENGMTAEVTDSFTVLDPNDRPNAYTSFDYIFTADNEFADEMAELTNKSYVAAAGGGFINTMEYTLHFGCLMGDADGDGIITGSDATMVLAEYTRISAGSEATFTPSQLAVADVDNDGIITGSDATQILRYYTTLSSGGNPSWE